jgi:D-alanine-D-alanine ligase
MNKKYAKILAKDSGVPVCKDLVLKEENNNVQDLKYPLIIKPLELGSSVGIQKARDKNELLTSLKDAWQYGDALVEEFKTGREFTITVMEDKDEIKVLAITEIIPLISDFYDYKAKYEKGGSRHVCPAEIDKDLEKRLKENALKVFKSINCEDLARVDFVMDENNDIYFIDLNTIPGMTKTSLAPEAAQVYGLSFEEFLNKLIESNI